MKLLYTLLSTVIFTVMSWGQVPSTSEKLVDIDGNVYNTLLIGNQVWMSENLKVTKYRNGDLIGTTSPATLDIRSESNPKYQWSYDGNKSNVTTYGSLYTWHAATDKRGICPTGWHLPTDTEWTTLVTYFTNNDYEYINNNGFLVLPGGYRNGNGEFHNNGYCYWWSSTEHSPTYAYYRYRYYYFSKVARNSTNKSYGFCVRCLKD